MIGLIIALTVISQTNVMIDSYRQEIFEEMIFNSSRIFRSDIEINMETHWGMEEIFDMPSFYTNFETYSSIFDQTAELYNYQDRILESQWYSNQQIGFWEVFKYENNEYWNLNMMDFFCSGSPEFYTKIIPFLEGRLPENSSEVILIRPDGNPVNHWEIEDESRYENFTLNNQVNITLRNEEGSSINKTVTIKGVLTYSRVEDDTSVSNVNTTIGLIYKYLRPYSNNGFSLLAEPVMFKELLEELSEGVSRINWWGQVRGKIFFDHSEIDAYNVGQEMVNLRKFLQGLEEVYYSENYYAYIYSSIYYNMQSFQMAISALTVMLLLVSFPVICIALYLVIYSFGLIRRQKQDQIGILKTRGGSSFQIFSVLTGEMIVPLLGVQELGFYFVHRYII